MIYFLNILIIFIFSIISLSFLPSLGLFDATPILPVFFIIALSYFRKGIEPLLLAVLSGVIFDFFSPYPFGFFLFLFLFSATIVRVMFQEGMKKLDFYNYILWSLIISFLYVAIQIVFLFLDDVGITTAIISPSLISITINMIFGFMLYFGNIWYFDKIKIIEGIVKRR